MEITADQLGRWNTIRHPRTNEWVKTENVLHGESGTRRTPPAESTIKRTVYVTLEGGERLELDAETKVIRKE